MERFDEQYCRVCGEPIIAEILDVEPSSLKNTYVVHEYGNQYFVHKKSRGENL